MPNPQLQLAPGLAGLQVKNLRKSYKKRVVIRDFSMELSRGEVVALLGPNGSGKSTKANSIGITEKYMRRYNLDKAYRN